MSSKHVFFLALCLLSITGMRPVIGQTVSPAVDVKSNPSFDPTIEQEPVITPFNIDCDTAPGLIITDDGSMENAYSGNPSLVPQVSIVEGFSVPQPRLLQQVCLSFYTQGPSSLDFGVIILDDDGPGGMPGTILGTVSATISGIPSSFSPIVWHTVDLSSLNLTLSGTVYIGVRWIPPSPFNILLIADESPATPLAPGYVFFTDNSTNWETLQSVFYGYRSMMIRPQFEVQTSEAVPFAGWSLLLALGLAVAFAALRFSKLI